MVNSSEWEGKFRIRNSKLRQVHTSGVFSTGCRKLTKIRHVAHVPDALRIIEDGEIQTRLVKDVDRLNRHRYSVVWLSANEWGSKGSFFGTVEFVFNWKKLVKKFPNIYWVEAVDKKRFRVLITDRDLSNRKRIMPYDPKRDDGPIRKLQGKWYWNGDCTSEFMIEKNFELTDCTQLNFIHHNDSICHRNSTCEEKTMSPTKISGIVLAHLLGNGITKANRFFRKENADGTFDQSKLNNGLFGIRNLLELEDNFDGKIGNPKSARAVLRGAISMLGKKQLYEANDLISLLKSENIFKKALCKIVKKHFGIKSFKLPF